MAGSKTDYFENAVLNTHRGTNITGFSPYIGLLTALTNGETTTVTEASGTNYARTAVTYGAPSGGAISNSAKVTFPTPGAGGWGVIVGWMNYDASTAGNATYYSDQTPNKTINQGDLVEFDIGAITITET